MGRATAISFAKAGASRIAVAARSDFGTLEQEIHAAAKAAGKESPQVLEVKLDVQSLASVDAAAEQVEKVFGKLDVLVNNAGYLENFTPLLGSDPAEWWRTWEVNVRGVYYATRVFLPLLLKGTGKTIINLSSIGGLDMFAGGSSYETTKLAVMRLTEFTCTEYASQGVVAYAVHPGAIMTELASNMPKETHGSKCFGRLAHGINC